MSDRLGIGCPFVLAMTEEFDEAMTRFDEARMKEIVLQLGNRCAQLRIWLDFKFDAEAPDANDPIWEDLAIARERKVNAQHDA